jgi:hypothetical protein
MIINEGFDIRELFGTRYHEIAFSLDRFDFLTKGENPEVLTARPNFVAPVKLPLIEYKGGKMRYGMHTDMINKLLITIGEMHSRTRDKLYIQVRLPNNDQ